MKKNFQFSTFNFQLSSGFTLIELLVVVAILGVLAAGIMVVVNPLAQFQKANDAKRKNDLSEIQKALEVYYQDNGSYPSSSSDFHIQVTINGTISVLQWGTPFQNYMTKLPQDPVSTQTYIYYSPTNSNGQTYYLYAGLERGKYDAQACNGGSACATLGTSGFPAKNACGSICNFGVSSSNVTP